MRRIYRRRAAAIKPSDAGNSLVPTQLFFHKGPITFTVLEVGIFERRFGPALLQTSVEFPLNSSCAVTVTFILPDDETPSTRAALRVHQNPMILGGFASVPIGTAPIGCEWRLASGKARSQIILGDADKTWRVVKADFDLDAGFHRMKSRRTVGSF